MTADSHDADGVDELAGSDNQFVTFAVADEMFAVPMAPVQEIIRMPAVSHLPLAPRTLEGLANLRGRVLPIINLRRLFGCDERAHDDTTRALVIQLGQTLGFTVDRVASVINVEPGEIEPADSIRSIVGAAALTGVIKRPRDDGGHDLLQVVDFEKLIEGQFDSVAARGAAAASTLAAAGGAADDGHADDGHATDELRLVSFSVAAQEYALDIADVQEIVQLPERLTELPNAPAHVLGLISLRQRLLPLVSLRTLFGLPGVAYTEQQRIVVTGLPGGQRVGLVTDAVKEVLSVPRSRADAMPGVLAADPSLREFTSICRLDDGKRLVSIIATDALLRQPALAEALEAGRGADTHPDGTEDETVNAEQADDVADDDTQVVIFRLGAEEFGVPIMSVQEIVRVPETLTRVPKTPAFVEGVINLRGTVLPVIDQRARLGLPVVERSEGQRIMVYMLGGVRTGFIVDSVAEVLRIPRAEITEAPELSAEQSRLISRVANLQGSRRMVMLIDPQHLLHDREVATIRTMDPAAERPEAAPPAYARAA